VGRYVMRLDLKLSLNRRFVGFRLDACSHRHDNVALDIRCQPFSTGLPI